ncbi:hypothetical protein ACI65C_013839 [Semiaphis heraclei]
MQPGIKLLTNNLSDNINGSIASDRFITRSLTNLKYDVESIQKRLDLLISLQEKTYSFLTQNDCSILNSSTVHHFEITCIHSDDELVHFEDKLLNKEFRTQMISTLKRFMGDSISETVRKILQRLFTDSFLMHYSYIGFKGKQSINKMKNFENIPVKCIEKAIKSWLAQAPQRESPVLWDARCPDYKNRYKKADALHELAEALSTTPDSIDKKIKNITSQYAREKRLHEKATKTGAGMEFHSKWFGFNLMEFLKDKNQPRTTIEGGIQEGECENEEDDVLSVIYDEHTDDNNTDVSKENSIRFEKPLTVNTKTVTTPCITKVKRHEERSAKAFSILEAMHNDKKSTHAKLEKEKEQLDEFHSFGDMIGKQLRSLKTHHAQSTVQYLMNNIMYEAKMDNRLPITIDLRIKWSMPITDK